MAIDVEKWSRDEADGVTPQPHRTLGGVRTDKVTCCRLALELVYLLALTTTAHVS